jgi:hypothetical protein
VKRAAALLSALALSGAARAQSRVWVGAKAAVDSPVSGRVVALGGSVSVSSHVTGDVVSWGSDVRILPGARIEGDLVAFGGRVEGNLSAVRGRILTPGSLSALYLAEARRAPWEPRRGELGRELLGVRLLILALWLALSSALLWLRGSAVSRAALCLEEGPATAAAAGVVTVVFLLLAGVSAVAGLPDSLRVPVAAILVVAAAGLKIFGMSALFLLIGQRLRGNVTAAGRPGALALGLAAAGAVSLVPGIGAVLWSAASILGVGTATASAFGLPRFRVAVASPR